MLFLLSKQFENIDICNVQLRNVTLKSKFVAKPKINQSLI